jgi:hypothetical protein
MDRFKTLQETSFSDKKSSLILMSQEKVQFKTQKKRKLN